MGSLAISNSWRNRSIRSIDPTPREEADIIDTPRSAIVIGAGIVGSSCAWELQRAGIATTLVDPVPPGQATSYGNAGCISPSGIVPFSYPGVLRQVPGWLADPLGPLRIRWGHLPAMTPWLWRFWRSGTDAGVAHMARSQHRLMQSVTGDWDRILSDTDGQHLRKARGVIMVYDTEAEFERDAWQFRLKDELGLEWRRLGDDELKELEPSLAGGVGAAILLPDWQHVVDPGGVTALIAHAAVDAGARILDVRARHIEPRDDGVRVTLDGGETLHADQLVIAAGAWSNELLRQIDRSVPLAPKRGYHSMLRAPNVSLNHPVQSVSRLFVMTPMDEGLRVAGTAEFARLDAEPDYRRARVLVDHARHYLPQLEFETASEWMGQRPMLPDSLPVIGRSPRHARVHYAFGHGHWGLTQGPTTGRLVRELITGQCQTDLSPFSPERF